MILIALLLITHVAVPSQAKPSSISVNAKASSLTTSDETQLRAWLGTQKPIRKKLAAIAKEAKQLADQNDMSDLKDSLGPKMDSASIRDKVDHSKPDDRKALLGALPGMTATPFDSCRSLEDCAAAPTIFHVIAAKNIEDAIAALVRPWMLLQGARGKGLSIVASVGPEDRLLKVQLNDIAKTSFEIHTSPAVDGGFDVSVRGQPDLTAFYLFQRQNVLTQAY